MALHFYKYQGTGNDFIIIDNRNEVFKNDTKTVKNLCDRRFGIGGDGLLLLEKPEHAKDDFKMVYYNSDGKLSTMCGNGGRCLVHFAHSLGIFKETCYFSASDGRHHGCIEKNKIVLGMNDVKEVKEYEEHFWLDTGSPHHVEFVGNIGAMDVAQKGSDIRYSGENRIRGVNVDFVQETTRGIAVRTYERGVEAETLSCGTGVTAAALASYAKNPSIGNPIAVQTPGGNLKVRFSENDGTYSNIELIGPAQQVFKGEI